MEPRRPHADPHRHPRFDSKDRKTIDNSSSATLNKDTHRQQQKNSVNWKLSKDGRYWLAELVLHKDFLPDGRSYEKLGMKVVGGQKLDRTRVLRAIVQDIREGSLAHHVGHIRPGDEVLEWNGTLLRGKSKETVANIIALSKNDSHVRLVLIRRFGNTPPPLDRSECRRSLPPYMEVHPESLQRDPRYLKYLDGRTNHSPAKSPERSSIGGRIQVGLWYDQQTYQLIVTVVCAKDLLPRPDMSRRNTYIKVVLLPDNSKENKRRSKAIADTNDPQFNQTFFFHHLRQTELRRKALQISAWDYDRRNAFIDFLGEVVISLQAASSNELPQWYNLSFHTDGDKACPGIMPMSMTGRTSDEGVFPQKQKFCAHTERRIMAVDCSSPSYEKDGRQQNSLPIGITPTSPQYFPMSERSRPLATASPMVEYPRHRSRENGFENRRRTQFIADPASRRTPDYSSKSLSPPEMRPQIQPMPHPSNAHHDLPQPKNVLKRQQLPQVPIPLSDGYHQFLKTRNSAGATASERRTMAVDCSSRSYEKDGRQQNSLPIGITPTSPQYSPMSDRSRPLANASPMVENPRHRSREAGFENRRRTQFIADPASRRTPDYSSRSLSPPEMRPQIQPMPRPANAHHDLPQPKNVLKKQQLSQDPIPRSDGYHQFLKTRNSAGATASERRTMAVDCSSRSYEKDGRQQNSLPIGITPTSPQYSPMSDRSRPLANASPMVENPRHRSREAGFENRRRTQFIADPASRRTPDYSSRSLSPPEMRPQIQPMPRPANAHHDLPQPKNVLKKQQLSQDPIPRSDGYHQFLKTRNSAGATASERRTMAVDCSSRSYEKDGRQQNSLPIGITPTSPQYSPMSDRSRPLANASPMVENPRHRSREAGFENRRRTQFIADPASRRTPDYSSRSLSPPEMRPQIQPMPRPANAHHDLPQPKNVLKKQQLSQDPIPRSDGYHQFLKTRNSAGATASESRIMAVDCSPASYEKDGRQQTGLPMGITPTSPQYSPMSERSRPLANASPMVENPRHRSREDGFENRRRTQFIADPASRRTPDYSSRAISPPEIRPQIQPMPRPANAHHDLPQPKNVLKKQQLSQDPIPRSDGYHQFLKTRNSAGATASESRRMAVDCKSPSYERDGRQQTGLPMGITPTSPQKPPMTERSRPLATASPMVEYPRHRSRESGFENRRRTQFIADPTSRRTPDYSSRSLSPPERRPQIQPMPRPANAHHDLPQPKNVLKKQQLSQDPIPRSDGYHQFLKTRNSAGATASGGCSEYDRSVQCRGGESRMAAAPAAGTSRPPVGPERGDSERSLSSASHSRSRTIGEFTRRSSAYGGPVHPSSREIDGSLSDTVVGFSTDPEAVILRSTLENSDAERSSHLSKKSSSTSQLSVTGLLPKRYKRNFFFWRRNGSSLPFVVRRSEEILPDVRTNSSISSDGNISGDSLTRGPRLPPEVAEASSFVENLGPGQVVGRQALVSLSLGHVELRICRRKKELEVDVIRARGLKAELGSKSSLPDSYVEIYLMDSQKSIAKKKTATARKTLDPLYQQQLVFPYDCQNCYLQVMVWGNYDGMKQPKFMGVAQIVLDDIDLEKDVIASYKLFHHFSLVN